MSEQGLRGCGESMRARTVQVIFSAGSRPEGGDGRPEGRCAAGQIDGRSRGEGRGKGKGEQDEHDAT